MYTTCNVISSLRNFKQTCWQTGNMNFQNGTNCALQKLPTAFLLPLLCNCGHFYRHNLRSLKANLAQKHQFQWLEFSLCIREWKIFQLSLEIMVLVIFKYHEVGPDPRRCTESVCLFAEGPRMQKWGCWLYLPPLPPGQKELSILSRSSHRRKSPAFSTFLHLSTRGITVRNWQQPPRRDPQV